MNMVNECIQQFLSFIYNSNWSYLKKKETEKFTKKENFEKADTVVIARVVMIFHSPHLSLSIYRRIKAYNQIITTMVVMRAFCTPSFAYLSLQSLQTCVKKQHVPSNIVKIWRVAGCADSCVDRQTNKMWHQSVNQRPLQFVCNKVMRYVRW